MSFEPGGRSDKYGNDYENKIRVKLFLRIIKGDLKSMTVEPIGEYTDSVEYVAIDNNDVNWHYQCKGSNGVSPSWTASDLNRHKVFTRSKEIILSNPQNRYVFVSPLSYGELPELCKRARTNASPVELVKYQLNTKEMPKTWKDCAKYFKLDTTDPKQLATLVDILAKSYFETVPMGLEETNNLNDLIGAYFTGDSQGVRMILEDFVTSDERLGVPITADEIITLLEKNNYHFRKNLYGENNVAQINELNRKFLSSFLPINDTIIHRAETDEVIDAIDNGNSVILHGKAGVGKSGCVCEIIDKLTERNIYYLALKLDNDSPSTSTDVFGQKIGLKQSPVCCLHNISAGKPCVLILDQLDALRWTSNHSSDALYVCKEFIRQAKVLNEEDGGHISLVFITRTFDLENDNGLKNLFSERNNTHSQGIAWSEIRINPLTKDDVRKVLGEEYSRLSLKLQNILLTPSSLYIWTQLERDSASLDISTPFDLMDKWWKQILDNFDKNPLIKNRIIELKNFIVNRIELSSSSWLSKSLCSDYNSELPVLISNGLLIENGKQIAFSHQSFLDYFAVFDMLNKIYSGSRIKDVIGTLDQQTPYIRYRLLRVLQTLQDDQIFLKLCREIMDSDEVRYYFKATVFEVLGQVETPNNSILEFSCTYLTNQDWHEYVLNSVYLGHPQYILSLDKHKEFNWLDEDGLNLLYSINTKAQDFLLEKIKPLHLNDKEDAIKIYSVLGRNCSVDSPEKLELRLKLYDAYYDFLDSFWGYYQLVKDDSLNLIPILKLVIKNSDNKNNHIYLGEKDVYLGYSKRHYREIINELLPEVCEKTMQFNPRWPNYEYNDNYSKWTKSRYNEHAAREIVEMVKGSLCEFALIESKSFLKFIKDFDGKNSVVYYELISSAINNLSIDYSDDAINWLSSDPTNHFFIYTENGQDYLSLTKKIIEKFSTTCSYESFQKIENIILRWSEPAERMLGIYRYRLEVNNEAGYLPVYYAYWGHLQKELLPFLDSNRISKDSQNLIQVLNRNSWIKTPFYYQGWSNTTAMVVRSPIDDKLERISDKTWKKIISTPNSKMKNFSSKKEKKGYFIEANHIFFSESLYSSAKKEPVRFAKLSLSFPRECFSGYITGVIRALHEHEESIPKIDFSVICDVINCFIKHSDPKVIAEILKLIGSRAEENWPDNIVEYVCNAAMVFSYSPADSNVNNKTSSHSLMTRAINSVRRSAIETMAQLLYNHCELSERFKPIVRKAINDSDQAVRFFSLTAIYQYYNIDESFCIRTLKELIQNEISVLGHNDIWELICSDFPNNSEFYTSHLIAACSSDIEELGDQAASYLCAIAIYFDFSITERLYKLPLGVKQRNNVCRQAALSFSNERFNSKSKAILLHYIDEGKFEADALTMLFRKGSIDINRDEEFLIKLIMSMHNTIQLHTILNYINEQDQDISKYTNVLYAICQEITQIDKEFGDTIANDLIRCLIKLLDKNNDDSEIKEKCLEMWDIIYKSNFNTMMPFSQMLDNFSE